VNQKRLSEGEGSVVNQKRLSEVQIDDLFEDIFAPIDKSFTPAGSANDAQSYAYACASDSAVTIPHESLSPKKTPNMASKHVFKSSMSSFDNLVDPPLSGLAESVLHAMDCEHSGVLVTNLDTKSVLSADDVNAAVIQQSRLFSPQAAKINDAEGGEEEIEVDLFETDEPTPTSSDATVASRARAFISRFACPSPWTLARADRKRRQHQYNPTFNSMHNNEALGHSSFERGLHKKSSAGKAGYINPTTQEEDNFDDDIVYRKEVQQDEVNTDVSEEDTDMSVEEVWFDSPGNAVH